MSFMGSFEDLVAEGAAVPLEGWDFSWFEGRATEERPPWGYAAQIAARLAAVESALDLQTGGGEVTASAPVKPPLLAATESWPPNAAVAKRNLPDAFVVQMGNLYTVIVRVAEGARVDGLQITYE